MTIKGKSASDRLDTLAKGVLPPEQEPTSTSKQRLRFFAWHNSGDTGQKVQGSEHHLLSRDTYLYKIDNAR